jgi:CBS domain-containing protein
MKIQDVMVPCPYHVDAAMTLDEALHTMSLRGVRHLPVVTREGDLLGVVTERALRLTQLAVAESGVIPLVESVCDVNPHTVTVDTLVSEVALDMAEKRLDYVLIVDAEGTLSGIFTAGDACRLVYMLLEEMGS